jgi:hypothetical protein
MLLIPVYAPPSSATSTSTSWWSARASCSTSGCR